MAKNKHRLNWPLLAVLAAILVLSMAFIHSASYDAASDTYRQYAKKLLEEKGAGHILITGGGIIPQEDVDELSGAGVGKLFTPGAHTGDIVEFIREEMKKRRQG